MIKILVVEDCPIQRRSFVSMIYEVNSDLQVYEADNKEQALKIAEDRNIDFFFIDIELNQSSGLDFALEIRKIPQYKLSWIIFITTHIVHMLQAFKEVHCYDYVMKPYDKEKIKEIIQMLIDNAYSQKNFGKDKRKYAAFNDNGIIIKIFVDEIIFIEVNTRNCIIHTKAGKYKISRLTLKKALELINEDSIIQCHRSYAININYVAKIEKYLIKSWKVYFNDYEDTAIIGEKCGKKIIDSFKNNLQYLQK